MKRRIEFGIVIFSLMLVLSLSFVSAGFFSNILNKFTGEVSYGEPFLAEKVISSCVETDKGLDYDKLGVIVVGDKKREDFCLNVGPIKEVQTHINEYFCDKNGEISFEIYKCPNGCVGGVCVNVEEEIGVLLNQESSDFVYGKISFWYGKVNVHTENEVWVTDPDGTAGAGTFSQWGADGWFDRKLEYCQRFWPNTVEVQEAEKENISVWRNQGNVGGPFTTTKRTYKCVQENSINATNNNTARCVDTDGGINYLVQGVASGRTLNNPKLNDFKDVCLSNLSVGEYFCENNFVRKKEYGCYLGGGYCMGGACKGMIIDHTNQTNETRVDLDKNLEIDSLWQDDEIGCVGDKCLDANLEGDSKTPAKKKVKKKFRKRIADFFSGIFGKPEKVGETDSTREMNETVCTDSDGGINYVVQGDVLFGEVNSSMSNYTDYCTEETSKSLREYYCGEKFEGELIPREVLFSNESDIISFPDSIVIEGNYAYISSRAASFETRSIVVLDISESMPSFVGTYFMSDYFEGDYIPSSLLIEEDFLYVLVKEFGSSEGGFLIFNISDPSNLVNVTYVPSFAPSAPRDLFLDENILYILNMDASGNSYITIFDVFDLENPSFLGMNNESFGEGGLTDIFVKESYAYVTDYNDDRIILYDVSNPNNINFIKYYENSLIRRDGVFISDNYLYVPIVERSTNKPGIEIIDISDPLNEKSISVAYNPSQIFASSFASPNIVLDGTLSYVSYYDSTSDSHSHVSLYDVSMPSNVSFITQIVDEEGVYLRTPQDIELGENYLYVLSNSMEYSAVQVLEFIGETFLQAEFDFYSCPINCDEGKCVDYVSTESNGSLSY